MPKPIAHLSEVARIKKMKIKKWTYTHTKNGHGLRKYTWHLSCSHWFKPWPMRLERRQILFKERNLYRTPWSGEMHHFFYLFYTKKISASMTQNSIFLYDFTSLLPLSISLENKSKTIKIPILLYSHSHYEFRIWFEDLVFFCVVASILRVKEESLCVYGQ